MDDLCVAWQELPVRHRATWLHPPAEIALDIPNLVDQWEDLQQPSLAGRALAKVCLYCFNDRVLMVEDALQQDVQSFQPFPKSERSVLAKAASLPLKELSQRFDRCFWLSVKAHRNTSFQRAHRKPDGRHLNHQLSGFQRDFP